MNSHTDRENEMQQNEVETIEDHGIGGGLRQMHPGDTTRMTPKELADYIATTPHVIAARHTPGRIIVDYPRDRGGRIVFTIQSARRHYDR